MSPKQLMALGLMTLAVATLAEVVAADLGSIAVFGFAGGCVFGKGYGIWEERSRRRSTLSRLRFDGGEE